MKIIEKVVVVVAMPDNNYAAYLERFPGCVSTGKTFAELKNNMTEAAALHFEGMREDDEQASFYTDYELVYKFDFETLLRHYSGVFTNASLARLTGLNQRQLQRYASGISRPHEIQAQKIKSALHNFGKELLSIEL